MGVEIGRVTGESNYYGNRQTICHSDSRLREDTCRACPSFQRVGILLHITRVEAGCDCHQCLPTNIQW